MHHPTPGMGKSQFPAPTIEITAIRIKLESHKHVLKVLNLADHAGHKLDMVNMLDHLTQHRQVATDENANFQTAIPHATSQY